jgi:pimeloyl-ACP methyl ester carboxylesterase
MGQSKTNSFYANVPAEQFQRLLDFRARYPYQAAEIQGVPWRFIDSGGNGPVVFVLAGGTNIAETSFQSLEHLARRSRVIAPDYPPVARIDVLFAGAAGLLDHLGIRQFNVVGGSYGGWMAQSLVRYCPDRVKKLVLTASGPPDPENSRQIEKMLPLLRLLPAALLRKMLLRTFANLVKSDQPGQQFMFAHLKETLYERVQRADIIASMQRLVDQTKNYTFTPDDLKTWPGKILLLFGSDDPAATPEKRDAMLALYPRAKMHIISGADHSAALTHQQEYFEVIDSFLAD